MGRVLAGSFVILLGIVWSALIVIAPATRGHSVGDVVPVAVVALLVFASAGLVLIWFGKAALRLNKAVEAVLHGAAAGELDAVASRYHVSRGSLEDAIAVQRRTDQVARMKAEGAFSWSWPAACGLGIWALWHRIWCRVGIDLWSRKTSWAWIVLYVALTIPVTVFGSMRATDLEEIMPFGCYVAMVLLWMLSIAALPVYLFVLFGRCGAMWLFQYKGIQPKTPPAKVGRS